MEPRRSKRNTVQTTRFSLDDSDSRPKRTRVSASSVEPTITMDLEPSSSSSSFVDSNRIATGKLTQIPSDSLKPGNLYSIWHKYEMTDDIADPVVGAVAGRPDSKDKYYVRFKGKFVGYDTALSAGYPDGITGIPPATELAVFKEVRIISKDKQFFTRDIYLIGKQANNPNNKLGFNISTYQQALNPALLAPPPANHPLFKRYFDRHIANGKGMVAFDMDYWRFANDLATPHSEMITGLHDRYNEFALGSFINTANPNLKATALAMGHDGINRQIADYVGLDREKIPKDIPEEQLSTLGSHFDAYDDVSKHYTRKTLETSEKDEDGVKPMDEVDGGAKRKTQRRKTRRNKTRKNKTRSKRRRSTRSRK